MAINFPNSPTTNQTVIVGTDTWVWNGVAWEVEPAIIIPTQTGQSGKYLTTNGTAVSWGTVTATAASVGLGNVTNESKATMFASPTFTGTVAGVTATHVGLGSVTNESKATMFASPTFTGTVAGVTATHVGLGNVTNESKATMFASPTFTGNTVISVTDNSNAALRITQLGTGNALVVEDITNPDASPFVITNNGSVVVGKDTPLTAYKLEINTVGQPFSTARFVNSSSESIHFLVRSRSATPGTYSSLIAQDGIASLQFAGDDGAAFIQAASIAAFVDGTPGLNDMPGRLVFSTTADGASTPTERMRISSAGQFLIGTSDTLASTKIRVVADTGQSYPLVLEGNSQDDNIAFQVRNTATASTLNQASFALVINTDGALRTGANFRSYFTDIVDATRTSVFEVNTAESGVSAPSMTILGRKVGIGTTTPSELFHVSQSTSTLTRVAVQNTASTGSGNVGAELEVRANVGHVTFGMYGSSTTGTLFGLAQANMAAFFTKAGAPADRFVMGTRTAAPYYIATNDVVRITVSSAGVVSLSSTEASTSTTTGALTVGGGVGIAGNLYVGGSILSRINSRITTAASASTLTPDVSVSDIYAYTALAAGLTVNAPIGTPVDGNKLMFRLLDNGTARALTWNATYTIIGVTLPTTTVVNKTTYVGCIYNANNTRWDVIAVSTQA